MAQLEQFSLPITAFRNFFGTRSLRSFDDTGRNLGDTIGGLLYSSEVGQAAQGVNQNFAGGAKARESDFGILTNFRGPIRTHGVRNAPGASGLNRVNDFEKRKPVEVGIPAADPSDSMLAHEDRGVRVMEQVACEVWNLPDNLRGDIRVSLGGDEDAETRRGEQRRNEVPGCRSNPGASHDPRVSGHAQEFIQDRPSGVPSICTASLAFDPVTTGDVIGRVLIRRVDQHIGVDHDHYCSSMAW